MKNSIDEIRFNLGEKIKTVIGEDVFVKIIIEIQEGPIDDFFNRPPPIRYYVVNELTDKIRGITIDPCPITMSDEDCIERFKDRKFFRTYDCERKSKYKRFRHE